MKHPDLINEFPNASDETKVRHFWKQLKKEDDLQLSLLSWISIFIGFTLVLLVIMTAGWMDVNPVPVTIGFGVVCLVILTYGWLKTQAIKFYGYILKLAVLWWKWLWRGVKSVCRWFVKNW